ncbi:MAG: helix-turn-helix transcriptional regulator [Leptospiraceae bacterium]|nr:helix-turn-helix transcriptional regulator [Leptospiraceae bacterium]
MPEQTFLSFPVLFTFAVPHAIFTVLFLLSKEDSKIHDILASIWIILLTLPIIQRFLLMQFEPFRIGIFFNSIVYPLTYGPMGYLYVKSLVEKNQNFSKYYLLHFLPILVFVIILSILPKSFHPNHPHHHPPIFLNSSDKPDFLLTAFIIDGCNLISMFTYSILILQILKKHDNTVENYFSTITSRQNLNWMKWVIWIFIILFTWNSVSPAIFKFIFHNLEIKWVHPFEFKLIHSSIFIFFSYLLSFFTIRQSTIYQSKPFEIPQPKLEQTKEEKYIRSGLKDEDSKKIVNTLLDYMEKTKPYLKEDLRIRDIADELKINLNYLSQTLNEEIQKNFYQFVNEYRIKEVQKRLEDPKYKNYPLMRIALDCGFNSKSSFNSTFRRFTNISPTEYRKSILEKLES